MSIVIESDISLLMRKLHISESKFKEVYANMDLEEIVEKEAEAGNQAAVAFAHEIFTSPHMLVKIFQLANPENKLQFLKELNPKQLREFLPLMEEEDLNQGLYFFDINQLMDLLKEIPPKQLVKVVFEMFSPEEVMALLPEEQLDKFLEDPNLDKGDIMKNLHMIPQEYLAQMYEAVSGEDCEGVSSKELLEKLGGLGAMQFQDSLRAMQPAAKQQLVLGIANANKDMYEKFDGDAYTNMMKNNKMQPEIVKAMEVIDEDEKIKMLEKLPKEQLAIVITQMDAQVFAEKIIKDHPELLAQAMLS